MVHNRINAIATPGARKVKPGVHNGRKQIIAPNV